MKRDVGLQAERTQLAWLRTSMVLVVNALLVVRSGFQEESLPLLVGGSILIVASIAFALIGHLRGGQMEPIAISMTQLQMAGVAGIVVFSSTITLILIAWR